MLLNAPYLRIGDSAVNHHRLGIMPSDQSPGHTQLFHGADRPILIEVWMDKNLSATLIYSDDLNATPMRQTHGPVPHDASGQIVSATACSPTHIASRRQGSLHEISNGHSRP